MGQHLIGIAQMKISDSADDLLVASNLGSCLGIAAYDPKLKIGGMIHCLLPLSSTDPEKARANPCTYVDSGVSALLEQLIKRGSNKKDLIIVAAGGANINDENGVFEIGKRNYTVLRKILWKNNLLLKAEHVGENVSRTISLSMNSGHVSLKVKGELIQLI